MVGGRQPLILRKVEGATAVDGESGPMGYLVGNAYVHGIMDGEAATDFEERAKQVLLM